MNLQTFLARKYSVLDFLNFLSSRALFSYKPLSYRKKTCNVTRSDSLILPILRIMLDLSDLVTFQFNSIKQSYCFDVYLANLVMV